MAKDKVQNAETPAAVQQQANEALVDEHTGKGGSYIIDPETGKRIPNPNPD